MNQRSEEHWERPFIRRGIVIVVVGDDDYAFREVGTQPPTDTGYPITPGWTGTRV